MNKIRRVLGRGKKGSSDSKTPITPASVPTLSPSNPFATRSTSTATRRPAPPQDSDSSYDAAAVEVPPPSYAEAITPSSNTLAVPPRTTRRNASPTPSAASAITIESITREDDPYAYLSTFDTVFLIDDSSSMKNSRWNEVRAVLETITPICTSHDSDGIDIYFLNHKTDQRAQQGKGAGGYHGIASSRRVNQIFNTVRPTRLTPTGRALERILNPYIAHYRTRAEAAEKRGDYEVDVKPLNIIVITDGAATDEPGEVIRQQARKLDELDAPSYQVGIQFFQVGHDPGAKESLRQLDDDLSHDGIRDMVDTVTWDGGNRGVLSADTILKAVLGGVVRRLDRQNHRASMDIPSAGPRGRR